MSSNEDMFALSDSCDEDMGLMSETNSVTPATPTPATLPTPAKPTPPSPTPPTPTPPQPSLKEPSELWMETGDQESSQQSFLKVDKLAGVGECSSIRIDFLDSVGNKVSQTRYTDNLEVIQVVKSFDCTLSRRCRR